MPLNQQRSPGDKASSAPSYLVFGLIQHKPPRFPWFQQRPSLEENAFKTPGGQNTSRDMLELFSATTTLHSLSTGLWHGSRAGRSRCSVRRPAGRYRPVLALAALELAVEGAGARPTGDGRRRGAGFAVQSQVDGGSYTALLQVNALRTPLMAQVG